MEEWIIFILCKIYKFECKCLKLVHKSILAKIYFIQKGSVGIFFIEEQKL